MRFPKLPVHPGRAHATGAARDAEKSPRSSGLPVIFAAADFMIGFRMPEKASPFEKRIKRHLLAKDHVFLAVVQPAFRAICRRELLSHGFTVLGDSEAGVEFSGRLE